jgi:hypothetical protein
MESFYSILYYKVNPLSDEVIALGLFGGGGEGPFFFLSENRLRLLKNVIHNNSYRALKRNVSALNKSIYQYRNNSNDLMLFDPNYSKEIFEKLSKKSKGSMLYSDPTTINDWMTLELFNELVYCFLGEDASNKKTRKKTPFHIKWRNAKKAARFDHLKIDVSFAEIANVKNNVIIDLYDKSINKAYNGIDFDLTQKSYNLKMKDILSLLDQTSFQLVLIAPSPRTKIGRSRKDNLLEGYDGLEILSLEELMKQYG